MGKYKEEDLSFLDSFDEQIMSEADVISLKHEALLSDLREIDSDLQKKRDRVVYYRESFRLDDLDELLRRVKKLLSDFT